MDPLYVKGLREAKAQVDAGTLGPEDFEKEKKKLLEQREEREREVQQAVDERSRKRPFGQDGDVAGGLLEDEWLRGCRCGKIKCLKLYCICFRNNMLCSTSCVCSDCHNDGEHEEERKKAQDIPRSAPRPPVVDSSEQFMYGTNSKWYGSVFPLAASEKRERQTKVKENGCMCGRTNCLKLYCRCFRSEILCTQDCVCSDCYNDGKHEEQRSLALRSIRLNSQEQDTERGCRCKRSQCMKKYCECFGSGNKCTSSCICDDCGNGNPNSIHGAASISKTLGKAAKARQPYFARTGNLPPRVEVQQIDLERLKKEVASRGGLTKVDQCREWRQIARAMDLAPNSTADPLRRRFLAATRDDAAAGGGGSSTMGGSWVECNVPNVSIAAPAAEASAAEASPAPPPPLNGSESVKMPQLLEGNQT